MNPLRLHDAATHQPRGRAAGSPRARPVVPRGDVGAVRRMYRARACDAGVGGGGYRRLLEPGEPRAHAWGVGDDSDKGEEDWEASAVSLAEEARRQRQQQFSSQLLSAQMVWLETVTPERQASRDRGRHCHSPADASAQSCESEVTLPLHFIVLVPNTVVS
ncbi:hypothetical protein BC834DRAFT_392233 [Gloeopeniophorella convolvens]|nr:hypothetical protein BC834DRAFT_392233 [Gloeopeniophorella convolvens]